MRIAALILMSPIGPSSCLIPSISSAKNNRHSVQVMCDNLQPVLQFRVVEQPLSEPYNDVANVFFYTPMATSKWTNLRLTGY
jgi:hypothetical protein